MTSLMRPVNLSLGETAWVGGGGGANRVLIQSEEAGVSRWSPTETAGLVVQVLLLWRRTLPTEPSDWLFTPANRKLAVSTSDNWRNEPEKEFSFLRLRQQAETPERVPGPVTNATLEPPFKVAFNMFLFLI